MSDDLDQQTDQMKAAFLIAEVELASTNGDLVDPDALMAQFDAWLGRVRAEARAEAFNDARHTMQMSLDAAIKPLRAEAWDEGHSWGWADAQEAHDVRQAMDRTDWQLRTPNPYREEQS